MTVVARARRLAVIAVLATVCVVVGCTETDGVVRDIGAAVVVLADPGASPQAIVDPLDRIQVAEWDVREAVLTLGDTEWDLLAGANCKLADTVFTTPLADGACAGGLVIDFESTPRPATLRVTFTMQVSRARPVVLPPAEDGEVPPEAPDGIPNDGDGSSLVGDRYCTGGATFGCDDNCPLLYNPDQADANLNGIGDACEVTDPFTLSSLRDSDGDGVADGSDNCIWFANPGQEDTQGPFEGIGDGIGDACRTQTAQVRGSNGSTVITIERGPLDFAQIANRPAYFVLDLDDRDVLADCNWSSAAPVCTLATDAVDFCIQTDGFAAGLGCF